MSTLKEKAEQVLVEKTNKIIPDNIKDGIEIFGVSGNIISGLEKDLPSKFGQGPLYAD